MGGSLALLGLIALSVWLGRKPSPRGERAARLRLAIPIVTLLVVGVYLALLYVPIGGGNTGFGGPDVVGIALFYLAPVALWMVAVGVVLTVSAVGGLVA